MLSLNKQGLSALTPNTATSNVDGLTIKQFKRSYNGDYEFNFITALSGVLDFQTKTYTNFYLTKEATLDTFIDVENTNIAPSKIFTTLQYGSEYLTFNAQASGSISFTSPQTSSAYFEIEFLNDSYCTVSFYDGPNRYFLAMDSSRRGYFTSIINTDSTFNSNRPQFFNYIYDTTFGYFYLFKAFSSSDVVFVKKLDNALSGININTTTTPSVVTSFAKLDTASLTKNQIKLNTSFVTYLNNNVDTSDDFTRTDIASNYLFFKYGDLDENNFDFLNLKNIANTKDNFYSNNNLISAADYSSEIYAAGNRSYTSIFNDIDQEEDVGLELNYVFTNQDIVINSNSTTFTTGSSLSPFTKININDTKIANCGSFSSTIPFLADKIYVLDTTSIPSNAHTYLCTWLSGSPLSREKVWVDRYFSPDFITRQQALTSNPNVVTSGDYIENLIRNNSTIRQTVTSSGIFDKRSDLLFEPNKTYKYERVQLENFNYLAPINFCDLLRCQTGNCDTSITRSNNIVSYFNDINQVGKFTLGFKFNGTGDNFIVYSAYNNIPGGIQFTKIGGELAFSYKFYDSSTGVYETYTANIPINLTDINSTLFTFDARTGDGILFLNNDLKYSFNVGALKYTGKRILFGDIFFQSDTVNQNILIYNEQETKLINDIYLVFESYSSDILYGISLNYTNQTMPDLIISIPCGMRNKTDTIQFLNSICNNTRSKTSRININIKNLHISSDTLQEEIKNNVLANIMDVLPVNTAINSVNFVDYK